MTSFAFIFGVVPLVVAYGAGAEMRRSLGTAVFSGMLGVTLFGIFLTPVFFYVIQGSARRGCSRPRDRAGSVSLRRWRPARGWRSATCSAQLGVVPLALGRLASASVPAMLVVLAVAGNSAVRRSHGFGAGDPQAET